MARSSDVAKRILKFKLQLSDTTEPATVLKILQKLKDLDITLEILAETGIGKTVNSLRRHKQAGEIAKALVKGWKKLVPNESKSFGELGCKNEDDDQSCPDNSVAAGDVNGNCLTSKTNKRHHTTLKHSGEPEKIRFTENGNLEISQKNVSPEKKDFHQDKMELSFSVSKKNKKNDSLSGDRNSESSNKKSKPDYGGKSKGCCEPDRHEAERESNTKSKSSKTSSMKTKEGSSSSGDKQSKTLKQDREGSRELSESSGRKRTKSDHDDLDSESVHRSKLKKLKPERRKAARCDEPEEPSMSFESYLNYDVNVLKRKEPSAAKKAPKANKSSRKELLDVQTKPSKLSLPLPEKKPEESIAHLMDIPLPASLPELEKPLSVDYYYEKKEKMSDFCEDQEESHIFTGQRLNRKMQVYSGSKTLFLPTMMSLYQQCIRTLQNNINLLYETGGVPFELLEPVLERCTPEQLLRIEEYNPIYIGLTDDLWGKHCQRDFKDCKLQEYESWKEMYIRLSEERERKLQRLTKTIVSAHSKKPKGRQVKMAFIHSVAKPPRDVRIQQEIHGTAAQQPHQLKCSFKVTDTETRPSCNESSRSSSTSTGMSNNQDLRKKTRVAPMMAKSLKAFKKQLGRR